MLPSVSVQCPHCGETITLLVDDPVDQQRYVEDCQVCCRPIEVRVTFEDGALQLRVAADSD